MQHRKPLNTGNVETLSVAIVENSDDAILAKTLDGFVLSWNSGATRIFGYTAAEMIGAPITRLFPPDRLQEEHELVARMLAGEEVSHFETKRIRKDGTLIDISVTLSAIRDQAGTIIAVSKIARDISEQVRLRRALDDASADLLQIIEHSTEMVSLWNPDRTNRFANRAYAEAYGYTVASIEGKHVAEVVGPEIYPLIKPRIDAAILGVPQSFEKELTFPTGRTRHLSFNYVPDSRREHLGCPGLFVFISDITDKKQAESETREREIAVNASRTKSEFLARMSHELRTPLNAILGFAQLLSSAIQRGGSIEKQLGHVQQIEIAGWHLLELVNDVLDISTIETGELTVDLVEVDADEAIDQALAIEAPHAQACRVHVEHARDPAKAMNILRADRTRLQQVLLNVISNAIKFNRPAGAVAVTVDQPTDQTIAICVQDSGIGMNAEQLKDLFQPFQRLGMERTRVEGVGMGLVVSRILVEKMGGSIAVSSAPGLGTKVRIELPRAPKPTMLADEPGAPSVGYVI